jgi:hypothetical protein
MPDSCTCACATTRRRRPTAAVVIASLALFMSLGGTSYAAVKAKSIGSKQLKSNAVSTTKIARGGVTASDIRNRVIDGSKIRVGSIDSQHILDGSIGSIDIADGSIGAQDIQPGSIGAREIGIGSIGPDQIANESLGRGDINPSDVNLFKDVPTQVVLSGGQNRSDQGMPPNGTAPSATPANFTAVRSYSAPTPVTGDYSTYLVQSLVSVTATGGTSVGCWISVNDVPLASTTVTVSGTVVIPLSALAEKLKEEDAVETRCRAAGTATADTRAATGATSMTVIRVAEGLR